MPKKIRVLVVDDSSFIRHVVSQILNSDPDIEVVATAEDPYDAREKIKLYNPDVMTLDIQMPKMNGIDFLEKVMRLRPMPVVMLSTLTEAGADVTFQALELGAVDYISKPTKNFEDHYQEFSAELIEKIKVAKTATIRPLTLNEDQQKQANMDAVLHQAERPQFARLTGFENANPDKFIIAIGSSTGGVEALTHVLQQLPENAPAILITQHMPSGFTGSFAQRLNSTCAVRVVEAKNDMRIKAGTVYIAPGNAQMRVGHVSDGYVIKLDPDGPLVSGHKPSVDVLFESVCKEMGRHVAGFILTGMGKDGAKGLKMMHDVGCRTFGQNEQSCVVYGMPKAAQQLGAVDREVHLNQISTTIMQLCM
ncbi:MAG: Protein-glutamate methylesterase/protein-glutamine glutaminase [Holosporales bacterium]